MIQLFSQNLLVMNADGAEVSLDEERLSSELKSAFLIHGIRETWMVENLVLCLEEKVRKVNAEGNRPSEEEINQMLSNMLTATGYGEVANEFLRGRRQETPLPSGSFRQWTAATASKALQQRLPLGVQESDTLAVRCLDSLQALGFSGCTEEFLTELAVLLLHTSSRAVAPLSAPPPPPSPDAAPEETSLHWQTQYITQDFWNAFLQTSPDFRRMLEKKILRPLPLSDIFPVARLEFRLANLCQLSGGWSAELPMMSALRPNVQTAAAMLVEMSRLIREKWPLYRSPTCHLIFPDFQAFFGKDAAFRQDVCEAIHEILESAAASSGCEMQVSFR